MTMNARGGGVSNEIELEEGLELYERASSNANRRFKATGLTLMDERPKRKNGDYFDGRLPSNIASLSFTELSDLLNMCTQWTEYVEGLLLMAKSEVERASECVKLTKSKVRRTMSGAAAAKDEQSLIDIRFVESNAVYLEVKEYKNLLEAAKASSSRNTRTVSRVYEMSRSQQEQGRRGNNVSSDRGETRPNSLRSRSDTKKERRGRGRTRGE